MKYTVTKQEIVNKDYWVVSWIFDGKTRRYLARSKDRAYDFIRSVQNG